MQMRTISLVRLLSSCLDANRKGCETIQKFYNGINSTTVGGKLKVEGDARSAVTQADFDAQAMIVGGLRGLWGDDLRIIGEEDEAAAPPIVDRNNILKTDLLEGRNSNFVDEEIPIDELALFVDPLDGTREFVEGRIGNVGCLIGICRNSRPIAGAVGVPFPGGSTESDVVVHYAIADQESSASWTSTVKDKDPVAGEPSPSTESDTKSITIFTGDSNDPILINATKCATTLTDDPRHIILGGTAAKLIRVATESNAIAVLHFKTELWDTASLQALLESKGGKITDLFGSPLVHDPDRPFGNIFGVVASSGQPEVEKLHDELCSRMRADVSAIDKVFKKWMIGPIPGSPQAVDISRDLDGIPLSVSFIQQQLASQGQTHGADLQSYSVPESGAWRGMMSSGVRLLLNWETKSADKTKGFPSSVFYKRIVMADLTHARSKLTAVPHKLVRDVKSYQVETSFLTSRACRDGLVNEAGVRVNKVYGADLRPAPEGASAKEQIESKLSALFEDFNAADGWEQQWLLDEEATKAALNELARMHAYFWNGSQFWEKGGGDWGNELEKVVWKNGGYMQPELQGYDQLDKVAKGWTKRYPTFKDALADLDMLKGESLTELGSRLQTIAHLIGSDAHPFFDGSSVAANFQKHRTLIHGDPKQANVFLKRDENDKLLHVGLVDFQWCGFGLAATDIAHHICAAVHPSCLSYDGQKEKELLDHYYSCLSNCLVKHGVAKSLQDVEDLVYPRAVLQEQYETALLDTARMVIAYAWLRWEAETHPTPESFNRNSYNKSLESALWLVTRCHTLLKQRLED